MKVIVPSLGHLRTVDAEDVPQSTGRSSLRSGGSRPSSSRRSARGQARVSLSDAPFKGRQDGAFNMFPNPLFENSNASLVHSERSNNGTSDVGDVRDVRGHSAGSARLFSTSADVGGDFNSGSNWRKKSTNFVVPSARQIRCRGRGMVEMPPNYGKDEYAGAGEYVNPDAQGPYTAFGVLQPNVELKAGTRQDPLSKIEHARLLGESGRIISTKHNRIRVSPQYQQALHGSACLCDHEYPNSLEQLERQQKSAPVQPVSTMVPPAGGWHPHLAV